MPIRKARKLCTAKETKLNCTNINHLFRLVSLCWLGWLVNNKLQHQLTLQAISPNILIEMECSSVNEKLDTSKQASKRQVKKQSCKWNRIAHLVIATAAAVDSQLQLCLK